MCQVLRHQRDEVTAEWRKSHSVVLHNLCCSHDIFWYDEIKKRVNESVCAAHGERKDAYISLVGKP